MFTHHNGEIAQAEAITRKPYVHYWMHNAHLSANGEKIAKSLGNGVTLDDVETRGFSGLDVRYLFLMAHYRSPMNFTWEALAAAKTARARLVRFTQEHTTPDTLAHEPTMAALRAALAHDIDTPKALATLWAMFGDDTLTPATKSATLRAADALLGIGTSISSTETSAPEVPPEVQALADARTLARNDKNWSESDRLRTEIAHHGFTVTDTPTGQVIERT